MPLKPDRLERTLNLAKKSLAQYENSLDELKIPTDQRKKSPRWRELNATCQQIENRIQSAISLATRADVPEPESAEAETAE
ncbi:MAG: hypothetical protein R3C12_05880 [Planctomycetaceae bacterium]|nr:hypothetical protein [Planctomycetaceae bacterium]